MQLCFRYFGNKQTYKLKEKQKNRENCFLMFYKDGILIAQIYLMDFDIKNHTHILRKYNKLKAELLIH